MISNHALRSFSSFVLLHVQAELVEMDHSLSNSPKSAPQVSPRNSKSSISNQATSSSSDAAITDASSKAGKQPSSSTAVVSSFAAGATSGAQVAPAGEESDSATSTLTTRASGQQHGMQLPPVKAQKGNNLKGAASGELGMGKRKMSGRFSTRQTSDELPDVTGRQSDHTTYDVTGVRRISTAGRRIFGGTNT